MVESLMVIHRRKIYGWHVGIWRERTWIIVDLGRWRFELIPRVYPERMPGITPSDALYPLTSDALWEKLGTALARLDVRRALVPPDPVHQAQLIPSSKPEDVAEQVGAEADVLIHSHYWACGATAADGSGERCGRPVGHEPEPHISVEGSEWRSSFGGES